MKVVCAWCGADMGEKDCSGPDNGLVSHSICERCRIETMAELESRDADREKNRHAIALNSNGHHRLLNSNRIQCPNYQGG